MRSVAVALVGDFDPAVVAHKAIPLALAMAGIRTGVLVKPEWLSTELLARDAERTLRPFDGAWCAPGSPYRSEAGALAAIRVVRETGRPFLGTCGGCQHAILEFARTVLGRSDAAHAENDPDALLPLIAPLSCALVESRGEIRLEPGSRVYSVYGRELVEETYHCRYGLNPDLEGLLDGSDLSITGRDPAGEARVLELAGHRFYVLTQFQPERAALAGWLPPLAAAFVDAVVGAV